MLVSTSMLTSHHTALGTHPRDVTGRAQVLKPTPCLLDLEGSPPRTDGPGVPSPWGVGQDSCFRLHAHWVSTAFLMSQTTLVGRWCRGGHLGWGPQSQSKLALRGDSVRGPPESFLNTR